MDGFLQLPVDPQPALAIHTLMTQLRVQVPALRSTSFLFNDYFVGLRLPSHAALERPLASRAATSLPLPPRAATLPGEGRGQDDPSH